MSLRSKPLGMVDELKDCLAPDASVSARGRPRRLGAEIRCRFAPNRFGMVDELKDCLAPDASGVFVCVLLRNKPLEIVDEQRIALLLRQPAQRASRLRRWALKSLTLQPLSVLRM
jgi:hypothetical protein